LTNKNFEHKKGIKLEEKNGMTTIPNKKSKMRLTKEEHQIPADEDFLKSEILEVREEMVTGSDALHFHKYLMNSLNDPKVNKMIKEALYMFPDPDKPTKLELSFNLRS
jgi:hypothetical protein